MGKLFLLKMTTIRVWIQAALLMVTVSAQTDCVNRLTGVSWPVKVSQQGTVNSARVNQCLTAHEKAELRGYAELYYVGQAMDMAAHRAMDQREPFQYAKDMHFGFRFRMRADYTGVTYNPGRLYKARDAKTGERVALQIMSTADYVVFNQQYTALESNTRIYNFMWIPYDYAHRGDFHAVSYQLIEDRSRASLAGLLYHHALRDGHALRVYIKNMFVALSSLHGSGVAHGNLNLETCRFLSNNGPTLTTATLVKPYLYMSDFNLQSAESYRLRGSLDMYAHYAPERIVQQGSQSYLLKPTPKTDMYEFGVTLMLLLSDGQWDPQEDRQKQADEAISLKTYRRNKFVKSDEAADQDLLKIIGKLLEINPARRISSANANVRFRP
jgi:hypothetical protein